MKALPFAGVVAVILAAPAFAQTSTVAPTAPTAPVAPNAPAGGPVVQPGGPGVANSGPGSMGAVSPSGTGADTITNNPGAANNSTQPSRPIPPTGGGG
jgi:hypothetical protein